MTGKVVLVGAGPGDPGLITVKGLARLRAADVVIYDRLIPHELLAEARPGAELVDAGKMPAHHRLEQDTINAIIVARARVGCCVVRLKGGDPFIFGRGGEEALACVAAGIPFEVVPGVSSVNAVPAYAGIPLTHREVSRTFTVISGHDHADLNYAAAARCGGTLVVLMGVGHLPQIITRLIAAGLNHTTPAACIEWGTTNSQRVIEAALIDLPERAARAGIQSPATIVIGDVVALRAAGINWFGRAESVPDTGG